ncbi:hypothetical protein Micbo1qcDRAFT_168361 [Microdochium bolleyi]|uniref:Zn(2)-C6 fungal-type domain-containing protein n=1 Tax=Microdochium bolleyi TaxID=196109 RepID=A0A136INW1_9PEZI|nr:hypothetical protein Micbo1qcDRAFT_168361 [Microdochium bolleyi]
MPARKASSAEASTVGDGGGSGTAAAPVRPKGRPRGFRRDRDCRTCKARNVKCDLNRPSCGICVMANVPCQGYATTVRWANSAPSLTTGASSSSTSSPRKSTSAAPTSASSFSASPSCGPSPSSSHSSAASPPDTFPKPYLQQQLPLPSLDSGGNGRYTGAGSGHLANSVIPPPPPSHRPHPHPHPYPHPHSHPGVVAGKFHNPAKTMTETPLQVQPDQRAQLLVSALEDNPSDSNWTTHYLRYYEYFTAQFEIARRTVTRERRYRPDMVMLAASPDPDRQPMPPHLQQEQDHLAQQPPHLQAEPDHDLKNVWLLLYHRISGQVPLDPAFAGNDINLLTTKAGALAEVKDAIRAGDILAIYGVATLSFLDVYEGPFIDCQWHMLGARALLLLHCHDKASLDELCGDLAGLREAISLLSWYDTMGFFFEQDRRNALVFPDWVREGMPDDFFDLVSCPKDTYMVYAAVVKARTAHRGHREDGDETASPAVSAAAGTTPNGSMAAGGPSPAPSSVVGSSSGSILVVGKTPQQQQRDMKLTMLAVQQILRTTRSKHGEDRLDQLSILQDCFRYGAALIATETAHAPPAGAAADSSASVGSVIDHETGVTLSDLADRVCDKVLAGVPVNSGRYRHLACQVTILGHHARSTRHRQAVNMYWQRCNNLSRPIYPNGMLISNVEEHWTRILGKSTVS